MKNTNLIIMDALSNMNEDGPAYCVWVFAVRWNGNLWPMQRLTSVAFMFMVVNSRGSLYPRVSLYTSLSVHVLSLCNSNKKINIILLLKYAKVYQSISK